MRTSRWVGTRRTRAADAGFPLLLVTLCALGSGPVHAESTPPVLFPPHHLSATAESTLNITLQADFPVTRKNTEEMAATLVHGADTTLPVKLAVRGKSRRRECRFPPLSLNFRKKTTKGSIFAGQNKLKLVTHCSGPMAKGPYLASEMLAYLMLNQITDASFRVRALNITYEPTSGKRAETHYGFLIEHKKAMAKRNGLSVLDVPKLRLQQLDADHAAIVSVFQYLLGNTDYSLLQGPADDDCCHNAVPIAASQANVLGIPYDFDATGWVNAPYAQPAAGLNIVSVTSRKHRGYCAHKSQLPQAIATFLTNKGALLKLVSEFDAIPGLNRKRSLRYLQAFFKTIENPPRQKRALLETCR